MGINIAILGYGTVGSGVAEVLNTNRDNITKRAGQEINLKYVLDLRDFEGDPIQEKLVHDYDSIVNDSEIQIIVETMGGVDPAYRFVKEALAKGKSVCTSNKELVARYGAELLSIAKKQKVNFLFEASVGGGIPIIRPLNQSLTCDEIMEITGILNGTTNYILTKMNDENIDFQTALREAQAKGYAERNPEADVEGYDTCRKIAILTSLAYGMQVDYEDIYTEGITGITDEDMKYARALGASIKMFGSSRKEGKRVFAMVAPVMISRDNPLYSVNDVFNAIFVKGDLLGDVMFYGKGAGKLPTASAVVSDVVDAAKHYGTNIMTIWSSEKLELGKFEEAVSRFFIRLSGTEEENAERVEKAFGEVKGVDAGLEGEYAFLTGKMTEREFADKVGSFTNLISRLRVTF